MQSVSHGGVDMPARHATRGCQDFETAAGFRYRTVAVSWVVGAPASAASEFRYVPDSGDLPPGAHDDDKRTSEVSRLLFRLSSKPGQSWSSPGSSFLTTSNSPPICSRTKSPPYPAKLRFQRLHALAGDGIATAKVRIGLSAAESKAIKRDNAISALLRILPYSASALCPPELSSGSDGQLAIKVKEVLAKPISLKTCKKH